jgi:hypothetical protein
MRRPILSETTKHRLQTQSPYSHLYRLRRLIFWSVVVFIIIVIGLFAQERPIYDEATLLLISVASLAAILVMLVGTRDEWTNAGVGIFFNKWGAFILFGSGWLALHDWGDGITHTERAALRAFYCVGSTLFLCSAVMYLRDIYDWGRWYIRRKPVGDRQETNRL